MRKLIVLSLMIVGASTFAMAFPTVPEIDGSSATTLLALLSGAVLLTKWRNK